MLRRDLLSIPPCRVGALFNRLTIYARALFGIGLLSVLLACVRACVNACSNNDAFDFLVDIVPREDVKAKKPQLEFDASLTSQEAELKQREEQLAAAQREAEAATAAATAAAAAAGAAAQQANQLQQEHAQQQQQQQQEQAHQHLQGLAALSSAGKRTHARTRILPCS